MKTIHRLGAIPLLLAAALGARAAFAQEAPRLFFEGDMVTGGSAASVGLPVCVLSNQFKLGQQVVWRIRVRDAQGRNLDGGALKAVAVELPDGRKLSARFGQHPGKGEPTDFFWSAVWTIPADHPTGTIVYKVVATDASGASTSWEPFKVRSSQFTIVK